MTSNCLQTLRILGLVCLCSSTGLATEETKQSPLAIESVLPITLDSTNPEQSLQTTHIRLKLSSGEAPITLEVAEARLEKHSTNFASAFTFGPVQGTAPKLTVPLEINLVRLPFVGTYIVKVRPVRAGGGQAETAAELEMTFERPSAQLAPVDELVLERDPITGRVDPDKFYITEQSGVAFAKFAFPLVSAQLRGPTGDLLPADLEFQASDALRSGQRLALRPVANGSLPLGASTGTVRLQSPQLLLPLDVKFKLVNRFSFGWLPVTIVAFIGVGIWFRKLLVDRQALDEALLDAQQSYVRLKDIADIQEEAQLQTGLEPLSLRLPQQSEGPRAPRRSVPQQAKRGRRSTQFWRKPRKAGAIPGQRLPLSRMLSAVRTDISWRWRSSSMLPTVDSMSFCAILTAALPRAWNLSSRGSWMT